ncbi:hypothetical protein Tco_1473675 [Tanacetum coccineum]
MLAKVAKTLLQAKVQDSYPVRTQQVVFRACGGNSDKKNSTLFETRFDNQTSKMAEQDTAPQYTGMKILIIKKGEYDIWSMRMCQYICHTYHNLWDQKCQWRFSKKNMHQQSRLRDPSAPPVPKTAKLADKKGIMEKLKASCF